MTLITLIIKVLAFLNHAVQFFPIYFDLLLIQSLEHLLTFFLVFRAFLLFYAVSKILLETIIDDPNALVSFPGYTVQFCWLDK